MIKRRKTGRRWVGGVCVIVASLTYLAVAAGAVEINAGWYRITCKLSGKCVEVQGWSKEDGGNVAQYGYHGGDNQLWRFDPVGGGSYAIISRHSGLCLEVGLAGGDTTGGLSEGDNVRQWEYFGQANQKWRIESAGGGYYKIVNGHSGMCLDVSNLSKLDGANIYQWGCHGGDNQLWELESVWRPENGSYVIRSRDSGKSMEVAGWGTTGGSNVFQYGYHGGNNQLWVFERIGGAYPDAFRIKGVHSGLYLGVTSSDSGSGGNGANAEVWAYSTSANQEWLVEHVEGIYYRIISFWSEKCLDVAHYSKADGGNIQQWSCSGAHNQQWALEIVTPAACSNCTKDPGEEGVDCGGACPACVSLPAGWENVEAVRLRGQPDHAGLIDIVFVPESSYENQMAKFKTDVYNVVRNGFMRLNDFTALAMPANVVDRFNFYTYTDGFAKQVPGGDAGCEQATNARACEWLPKSDAVLLEEMPGADLIVILRNATGGVGLGEGGPPWLYNGYRVCRAGTSPGLLLHEVGHALFDLGDEYCGLFTSYGESKAGPSNLWESQSACQAAANQYGWEHGACTEIGQECTGSADTFWRYDLDTCEMWDSTGPGVYFGEACSEQIRWVLANWPDGR